MPAFLPRLLPASLALALTLIAGSPDGLDSAFDKFWAAKDPSDAAKAAADIVKTGATFDEVYRRLKAGRRYSSDVPKGIVAGRRGEFTYTLDVPPNYDASRSYQVRFQLHGGVGAPRENSERRGRGGIGRLAGAEQIYVLPTGWNEEPWWSDAQVLNLHAILDTIKRTYNVDENRVVVSGVSDGGTGAFFVAMRDTTPYAAFLPLNGYILVLAQVTGDIDGDLSPDNLRNKPFFVVNGGRDPLYPIVAVEPSLEHLAKGGVSIDYKPQLQAGHDTSWWPSVKDSYEAFVREHPRVPLPDRLTWETSETRHFGRAHWLEIDALGARSDDAQSMKDLNDFTPSAQANLGFRLAPGLKISRVIDGSMGDRLGLKSGDVIQAVDDKEMKADQDLVAVLQTYKVGSTIHLTILRGGRSLDLSGAFAPQMIQAPSTQMFRRTSKSGRVDLIRTGNTVEASARGVSQFTLLCSPDQFDFSQPLRVVVNGKVAFDGPIEKNVATLLKWAARDNDRTMLFGAEIKIAPK
jgi:hypothetical protein